MSIINTFANWIVKWATTTVNPEKWFVEYFGGGAPTKAGIAINNDNALQVSTYFACVRNISEDVAKLPLITYKPLKPQGKERLRDHPLYPILHDSPNSEMTAMALRETLTAHALNWGNGYAYIERDRFNQVIALWPLRPDRVEPFRDKNSLKVGYEIRDDNGQKTTFPAFDIFHLHGVGFDGIAGYNVGRYARESVGAAIAAEQHGAYFFANGSNANGILEIPAAMSPKARENLEKSFLEKAAGAKNTAKTIVLEEGAKFNKTSIPPEEAQLLQTRQFSVAEICRWFRMPPNKVADTTRAQGWSTLEQTNTDYIIDTLMPWLVRWEQEVWRKLFTKTERNQGLFAKHLVDALLRGDIQSRYAAYAIGRSWGWLSADDIREKEEMNPLPDGIGKDYLIPLNYKVAGEPDPVPVVEPQVPPDEQESNQAYKTMRILFMGDVAARISNAEINEIRKHIKQADDRDKFNQWLNAFYEKHERYCEQCLRPLMVDSLVVAKELINANRFVLGEGNAEELFDKFAEQINIKNREFLNAKI